MCLGRGTTMRRRVMENVVAELLGEGGGRLAGVDVWRSGEGSPLPIIGD